MPIPPSVESIWSDYSRSVGGVEEERFYEVFHFGDTEAMANELGQLVLAGRKQATAGSVSSFAAAGKRIPQAGDLSVVTDWSGKPLCIIETGRVDVMPFDEVSAEFAAVEGEGDGSLEYWRRGHSKYFTRECHRTGNTFSGSMLVSCERFQVVYRPPAPSAA